MSSGLPLTAGLAQTVVRSFSAMALHRIETLGMTPRQQELNWLWAWYATVRYDARMIEWDGSERMDRIDAEAIATAGVLPAGYYDAGKDFAMKFRRPTAPYNLPRVIVNRFTSLLFSESAHPQVKCPGDEKAEDYVKGLISATRLWAKFNLARTYGGATGTFCVGFKFVNGKPVVEVHDPRWVTPVFKDKQALEVEAIDKRWMWPEHVLGAKGEYEVVWYWTRRIINGKQDVVWNKVPVGDGKEPDWMRFPPDQMVEHGFNECPVVWGHNAPVLDDEDGESDCIGCFDMVEEMDTLIAQGGDALKKNLDPTVVITTDMKLRELNKGSDNAIKIEKGGAATYLEGNFQGPKQGLEHAMTIRDLVLEVAQCVLEGEDEKAAETATKTRERRASMEARVDVLREQYGQQGVVPLLNKMLRAISKLAASKLTVAIPPRIEKMPDGSKTVVQRQPPEGDVSLELEWPPHRRPSAADTQQVGGAVGAMKTAGVISLEQAVRMLQPYTGVTDPNRELDLINSEAKQREQEESAKAKSAWGGSGGQ